ncbi:MAG: 2,3-diphosphoglycerate-dependent phosphoglycerate mutase [Alphaproteobacteria bacterium]|nr:2,3-diphosphoglycerate-dependent phosphoglycerate mutase [Alphaproteobacteria bacterium]
MVCPYQLVLLRHGESEWNKLNLFTGWRDVRLTPQGEREAREAGDLMMQAGLHFDLAFTSLLSRAIKTLWISLEAMDRMWIPVEKQWRLNERHYGALQGRNKAEAVQKFGEAQVKEWRRGYDTPPPPVDADSVDYPGNDPRYANIDPTDLPYSESLKDVLARVQPYWQGAIVPSLQDGKCVLIVAHGNSLRALMKHLEGIGDDAIAGVDLPTGVPRAYRLDHNWKAAEAKFLGDPSAVQSRIESVQKQTQRA